MQANAYMVTDTEEIQNALACLYKRKNESPTKRVAEEFLGDFPRRIYKAVPETVWINGDGDVNGNYIDIRKEVKIT